MKHMKKITTVIGTSMMILTLFTSTAYAQLGVGLDSTTRIKSVANIAARADGDSAAAETSTTIDAGLETTNSLDAKEEQGKVSASSSARADTSAKNSAGAALQVNALGIMITSPAEVNSEEDLHVFSSNVALKNSAVAEVSASPQNTPEEKITVVYKHEGKFLGFIPVTIKSTTSIKARGDGKIEVTSTLPWWSLFVAGENYNKADLESRIKNDAKIRANASVHASARAKAQVAEAVITELEASAAAQGNAHVR